jgi:hypothetical protein
MCLKAQTRFHRTRQACKRFAVSNDCFLSVGALEAAMTLSRRYRRTVPQKARRAFAAQRDQFLNQCRIAT